MQQEYMRRKKMNTYQERRKEGRTMHTKASRTAIIVGSLSWIFGAMAVVLPSWRSSWVGLIGYGTRRNWGLLYVAGRKTTFHHTMYDNNCKWYGHLMLGNSCLSPICRWYLLKCNVYFELCLYSYSAAVGVILGLMLQTLCLYWTFLLSTRSLRWAANWWPVAALLFLGGAIFWVVMTEGLFEQLNEESWYPVPPPGLSFILACVSTVGMLVNAYLGYTLHYMWPEVDPDDPDQFDSDDEEVEEENDTDDEKKDGARDYGYGDSGYPGAADDGSAKVQQQVQQPTVPDRQYYYQDHQGQLQGPWPAQQLLAWYQQGMLTPDIQIRASDEMDFHPIGDGSSLM